MILSTSSLIGREPMSQFENHKKGPHGQVRGLRESILLAIKLNRTLVIPTFFIDGWDDPVQLSSALVWDKTLLDPRVIIKNIPDSNNFKKSYPYWLIRKWPQIVKDHRTAMVMMMMDGNFLT